MSDSFTDQIKQEIVGKMEGNLAEISALIRMNGSIMLKGGKLGIRIKIMRGDLARKLYSYMKDKYGFSCEIIVRRDNQFKNNNSYEIILVPQKELNKFLKMLNFLDTNNNIVFNIRQDIFGDRKKEAAYLRGVFLGGGSVNDPHGEYHLELRCEHESHARDLVKMLADFDLNGKIVEHKGKYVLYLKNFSSITSFLNIIGASKAQLEMENVHTVKEVKNNVNRRVNAETANLDKTVKAAQKHLEDIELIARKQGLDSLSDSLREIALLRKKHPYASLKELGQKLDPSLSKSGVNHRFRRLRKIARELK